MPPARPQTATSRPPRRQSAPVTVLAIGAVTQVRQPSGPGTPDTRGRRPQRASRRSTRPPTSTSPPPPAPPRSRRRPPATRRWGRTRPARGRQEPRPPSSPPGTLVETSSAPSASESRPSAPPAPSAATWPSCGPPGCGTATTTAESDHEVVHPRILRVGRCAHADDPTRQARNPVTSSWRSRLRPMNTRRLVALAAPPRPALVGVDEHVDSLEDDAVSEPWTARMPLLRKMSTPFSRSGGPARR